MIISLESVLESPDSQLFHDFAMYLSQSYCIENLTFWLATQEYHKNQQLGEKMINLYIRPNSSQEINIPCEMRRAILDQKTFEKHLFDEAAETVMELMRVNSFFPWIYQQKKLQHSSSAHTLSSIKTNPIVERRCSSLDGSGVHGDRSTFISLGNNNNNNNTASVNTRYKAMLKRVKKTLLFGLPML